MKAVIPVAGVGTKLRPHTHTQPKPLIPVAGKPILGHIIDQLLGAGIKKQVFIIGYMRDKIRDFVLSNYSEKIDIEFVVQEPRKGLAHALWIAKKQLEECDEILVNLGDTIFGEDLREILEEKGSRLAVQEVDNPREFGIAQVGNDGLVTRLMEKPDIPRSNLALIGLYKIAQLPLLWESLEEMLGSGIDEDKEYSLTDALMMMVDKGASMRPHSVSNWYDCGRKQSLLLTNRILLTNQVPQQNWSYDNSVIIPPVHIAEGCHISHSVIGPYVAIAEQAQIRNSIVRDSILGAYSQLESIILRHSVIGNDTSLRGKSNSINIGDNTEIDFDE
ncbi:MAG: sugar phosphate nucleotidyltransferase [Bacteroidota bacterium]